MSDFQNALNQYTQSQGSIANNFLQTKDVVGESKLKVQQGIIGLKETIDTGDIAKATGHMLDAGLQGIGYDLSGKGATKAVLGGTQWALKRYVATNASKAGLSGASTDITKISSGLGQKLAPEASSGLDEISTGPEEIEMQDMGGQTKGDLSGAGDAGDASDIPSFLHQGGPADIGVDKTAPSDAPAEAPSAPEAGLAETADAGLAEEASDAATSGVEAAAKSLASSAGEAAASLAEEAGGSLAERALGFLGSAIPIVGPLFDIGSLIGLGIEGAKAAKDMANDPFANVANQIKSANTATAAMQNTVSSDQFSEKLGAGVPSFGSLSAPSLDTTSLTGSQALHF